MTDSHRIKEVHLDWSSKQGRILTGSGIAEKMYTAERGFPFSTSELPHFYKMAGTSVEAFKSWKEQGLTSTLVVGAWSRPLFVGGWEHSTDRDELVFNLQTPSLFIDLRLPRTRAAFFHRDNIHSLSDLTDEELRLFARQHVFGGYTLPEVLPSDGRTVCTRHHCIDWNFVGKPRSRPNKWYVEMNEENRNMWKELLFAKDEKGSHYYWERWERHLNDGHFNGVNADGSPVVGLRRNRVGETSDALLIIIGSHFNYLYDRGTITAPPLNLRRKDPPNGVVSLVDMALEEGNRALAEQYLSIDAGHGTINSSIFYTHNAIRPWNENTIFLSPEQILSMGESFIRMKNGETWEIFETNLNFPELKQLFGFPAAAGRSKL